MKWSCRSGVLTQKLHNVLHCNTCLLFPQRNKQEPHMHYIVPSVILLRKWSQDVVFSEIDFSFLVILFQRRGVGKLCGGDVETMIRAVGSVASGYALEALGWFEEPNPANMVCYSRLWVEDMLSHRPSSAANWPKLSQSLNCGCPLLCLKYRRFGGSCRSM